MPIPRQAERPDSSRGTGGPPVSECHRRAARATRPARVCFLIDELAAAGTETQLLALIRHVDRERVQPHPVLLRGESASSRALEPDCCPVLRLNVGSLKSPAT